MKNKIGNAMNRWRKVFLAMGGVATLCVAVAAGMFTTPRLRAQAPEIFTVIQEQLGLKLEPIKGPGDFLVIDHVERPTPN